MSVDRMYYQVFEETSHIGSFRCTRHEFNMETFEMLRDVLAVHKYFLICIGSSAISIIHLNEIFYIYDPHGRKITGFPDQNGTAVLLTFKSLQGMNNFIRILPLHLNTDTFELNPVQID